MIKYLDQIHEYLDVYAPKWVTRCVVCRQHWFGILEGVILSLGVLEINFYLEYMT